MLRRLLAFLFCVSVGFLSGQVLISSGFFTYTQNFGSSGPASWTDNVSYLGWYQSSSSAYQGYINITAAAPSNNGGVYTYQCAGNGNVKLGSRASGGSGTIRYGVRLRNTSGSTIQSITVAYDFFQLSLAQNGGNTNTIAFDYQVGASLTSLTAGVWTAVTALNFSQLQGTVTSGGSQINGYPCTQTGAQSAVCIAVNIPNNNEIMLRFTDVDDSGNDHHMAIDNFVVNTFTNNICSPLPVELISFDAKKINENEVQCRWKTASERNADFYEVEGSIDALHFIPLKKVNAFGESFKEQDYAILLTQGEWQPNHYYRLKQVDKDARFTYSPIVYIGDSNYQSLNISAIFNQETQQEPKQLLIKAQQGKICELEVFNSLGQLVFSKKDILPTSREEKISLPYLNGGCYIAILKQGNQSLKTKLLF